MDPDAAPDIAIALSKTKLVLVVIGALGFVALGIWMLTLADTEPHPRLTKAIAIAGIAFFGLCAVYGCIKIFDQRPGLIIAREGLVDNSSAVAAGRIPWDEITGLEVSSIAGTRFVTLRVRDPQKYVARSSFLRGMMNAANINMTGSPINIASTA